MAAGREKEATTAVINAAGLKLHDFMPLTRKDFEVLRRTSPPRLLDVEWEDSEGFEIRLADIERAIQSARLGLNPSNDGQIIRVPVPALTGERRQELVKKCGAFCEEARIRGRSVRKEYNDAFKAMENDKEITEDELKRLMELVQKATDANMASLSEIAEAKEKEVLDV